MEKYKKIVRMLLRVSSNQQLEADGDLSIQRKLVKEYITSHSNWTLDTKEYFEGSKSGYKNSVTERDVLQQALQDAIKKEYDVLVVYKDDRIGRRMWEIGAYVMQLKSYNVDIYTVKDGCISPDTDDIMGQMMLALRYGNAQKSSSDTGMRVKDTAQKLVQQGKFMGGKAPYGYELVLSGEISKHGRALKKLKVVKEKAYIVKYIYELAYTKDYGFQKIAKILNLDEYYSKYAPNDYWKAGTIRSILTNPVYTGYVAYKRRERVGGKYYKINDEDWIKSETKNESIAIIDEDFWNEVQRKRKLRSKAYTKKINSEEYNLIKKNDGILPLIDVAYCGYCGVKLTNGNNYSYWKIKETGEKRASKKANYKCQNIWKGVPHKDNVKVQLFPAEKIESIVFSEICKYLDELLKNINLSEDIIKIENTEYEKLNNLLSSYKDELSKTQKGISVMEEHIPDAMTGEYVLSLEQLASAIQKHKNKQNEIKEKINHIKEQLDTIEKSRNNIDALKNNIPQWKDIFMSADKESKRVLVNKIVDKIFVKKEEVHIIYKIKV